MKYKLLAFLIFAFTKFGSAQFLEEIVLSELPVNPYDIQAIDIDADGDLDLLLTMFGNDNLVFIENHGNGRYGAQKIISNEVDNPVCIFASDLDGDLDLDILSSSTGDNKIAWFENLGNGKFGDQHIISDMENQSRAVSAADIDGDGDNDIITSYSLIGTIAWHENLGDGVFGPEQFLSTGTSNLFKIHAEDIDEDGDIDILFAPSYNEFYWHENLGEGIFEAKELLVSLWTGPRDTEIVDLDADGHKDILVVHSSRVAWYKGLGDGTFEGETLISTLLNGTFSVKSIDLDSDGDLDILCGSTLDENIAWFENLGDTEYGVRITIADDMPGTRSVEAFDRDDDGDIDVFSVSFDEDLIIGHENLGDEEFNFDLRAIPYTDYGTKIETADISGNGKMDIIVRSVYQIVWYEYLDDERFASSILAIPSTEWVSVNNFGSGDIDNDGDADIIKLASSGDGIFCMYNIGDGFFVDSTVIDADSDADDVQLWDLDNDGDEDIIAVESEFESGEIVYYENLGDDSFGDRVVLATLTGSPRNFYLADINEDLLLDLITCQDDDDNIAWFENLGDGDFGPIQIISELVEIPRSVYAEDLDNDGDMDVLSASWTDDKIAWYENLGDGSFGPQEIVTELANGPRFIRADDLDGDGDNDIVAASNFDDELAWYENLGGGLFGEQQIISTNIDGGFMAYPFDVDFDGDIDIMTLSTFDDKLAWFPNDQFNPKQLRGNLFIDLNENGIRDSSELGMDLVEINSTPDAAFTYAYPDGRYAVNFNGVEDGTYEIAPEELGYWGLTSEFASYEVLVDEDFTFVDSLDFGFYPDTIVDEISTNIVGGFPRCNTIINYWLDVKNIGTTIPSGTLHLQLDDDVLYETSEFIPDSIVGQDIYWSYDSLFYFDVERIKIQVQMPDFMLIGDTLKSYLTTTIDSLDEVVFMASDTLCQTLVCAYDPNDKIADPAGVDSMGYMPMSTQTLEYTVRFQNTGTDTAFTVILKDELDTNLDWSSFEPLSTSHEMTVDVDYFGEITFSFEDVMLPDSNVNEVASHGFVKYKIDLIDDLPVGTSIYNTARIYFDANPAVITNTKINTIFDCQEILETAIFPSIECENTIVIGAIPDSTSETTYTWEILDLDTISGNNLNWFADTVGVFELLVSAENEFCSNDTLITFEIVEEVPLEILDSIIICSADSVLIFDVYQSIEAIYYDSLVSIHGCDSIIQQMLIVLESPIVEFMELADELICLDEEPFTLVGTPADGVFSGAGISESEFNPSSAGEGEHTLHYTFVGENGCSSTDTVIITVVNCLLLSKNNQTKITVFPNPFDDYTTINFGEELTENHTIIIHDILGQEVYRNENVISSSLEIKKEELGSGIYILTLFNNDMKELFNTKLLVE